MTNVNGLIPAFNPYFFNLPTQPQQGFNQGYSIFLQVQPQSILQMQTMMILPMILQLLQQALQKIQEPPSEKDVPGIADTPVPEIDRAVEPAIVEKDEPEDTTKEEREPDKEFTFSYKGGMSELRDVMGVTDLEKPLDYDNKDDRAKRWELLKNSDKNKEEIQNIGKEYGNKLRGAWYDPSNQLAVETLNVENIIKNIVETQNPDAKDKKYNMHFQPKEMNKGVVSYTDENDFIYQDDHLDMNEVKAGKGDDII